MVNVREDMTGWIMAEHGVPDSRLVVICQDKDYIAPSGQRHAKWLCECQCEAKNIISVVHAYLKNGKIKSCGCLKRERMIKTNKEKHKTNRYDLSGEYGVGWTSNTNKEFYFDLEDYDKIKDYCWLEHINKTGYRMLCANETGTGINVRMCKIVTDYEYCEHKDRNPLNNRKENLRTATHSENLQNMSTHKNSFSGFAGVTWDKHKQKWVARITLNYKIYHLGSFTNFEDAVAARLAGEARYFNKNFATHRDMFEQYQINVD